MSVDVEPNPWAPLALLGPGELTQHVCRQVRALRLLRGWTQAELAERAGVALPTYKRFERTGDLALAALMRVAVVLDCGERLAMVFALPAVQSLDQLLRRPKPRQRAPRRSAR